VTLASPARNHRALRSRHSRRVLRRVLVHGPTLPCPQSPSWRAFPSVSPIFGHWLRSYGDRATREETEKKRDTRSAGRTQWFAYKHRTKVHGGWNARCNKRVKANSFIPSFGVFGFVRKSYRGACRVRTWYKPSPSLPCYAINIPAG